MDSLRLITLKRKSKTEKETSLPLIILSNVNRDTEKVSSKKPMVFL